MMEDDAKDQIVSVTVDVYGNIFISTRKFIYRVSLEDEIPVIRRLRKIDDALTIRADKG